MKTRFQHIANLLLALLVLCSTQTFSINTHYCGSFLVDKAIMKPAKKCAMHGEQTHSKHDQESPKDDCCNDEFEMFEGQDQLQIQSLDTDIAHPIFLEAFVHNFIFNISFENEEITSFYEYPPPLYQRNFQALYQVYLI